MAKPRSRVSIAIRIPPDLAAEVRAFVRDNAGAFLYLNMTKFGEEAFRQHLARLRTEVEGRSSSRRNPALNPNHRR